MVSSLRLGVLLGALAWARAMEPFTHGWGTVASMMSMHGKYHDLDEAIPQRDIEFIAGHYATITTGTGCSMSGKGTPPTIEASVQALARRVKAVNPSVPVGMYWRVTTALEMAECRWGRRLLRASLVRNVGARSPFRLPSTAQARVVPSHFSP